MVLPLIDENKPKCFVCQTIFENMEELKKHQETVHQEVFQKFDDDKA